MESPAGVLWRIRLFGGPALENPLQPGLIQTHFRSTKVAALLSYLALHFERPCSREELMEALWPNESAGATAQNRLRVTLASLRKQLEPSGFPFGSVLDTSITGCVRLRPGTTWCDAHEFDRLHRVGDLEAAAALLVGPLLPGVYDEWARDHQLRYALIEEEIASHKPVPARTDHPGPARNIHRLPLFLSQFFARESELNTVRDLTEKHRLVTLTGPGGIGKTRLSVEACRLSDVPTYFVALVDVNDGESVADLILRQMGMGTQSSQSSAAQLLAVLQHLGPVRIILDNAESVLDLVREWVIDALKHAPDLRLLITSRQALEIMGETVVRLEPLRGGAASDLFMDRVRLSRPDFTVPVGQEALVGEICSRLEGLPLALELAAAQITVYTLLGILKCLDESLVELKSRVKNVSTRHQSLRAVIDSSLSALDPETLEFLGCLSVFSGGFTSAAAQAVTGTKAALEQIEELCSRSLLGTDPSGSVIRFTCLAAIMELSRERLDPDLLVCTRDRHRDYYWGLCAQVNENDLSTLLSLDHEQHNLLVAFSEPDLGSSEFWRANCGAIMHAFIRGQHRSALPWIRSYANLAERCPDRDVARDWLFAAGTVLTDCGLYEEADTLSNYLRAHAEEHQDAHCEVLHLIHNGLLIGRQGDLLQGLALHRAAYSHAIALGSTRLVELALAHLSGSLHGLTQVPSTPPEELQEALVESEALARELIRMVSPMSRRYPLAYLLAAAALFHQRRDKECEPLLLSASASAERLNVRSVSMYVAYFRAHIAERSGAHELAATKFDEFRHLQELTGIRFQPD